MDNPNLEPGAPNPDVVYIDWVDAPSESHLKAYRFVDRFFAKESGPSELYVTFRSTTSKKTGITRPEATYLYTSHDHQALRETFEKMTIAASPGTILHADLISQGNTGTPI